MSAAATTATTSDETLVIETPERVPLHFALASIGNRFLACAFDHTLQLLTMAVVVIVLLWTGNVSRFGDRLSDASKWVWVVLILSVFVIWSGYFALFEWVW